MKLNRFGVLIAVALFTAIALIAVGVVAAGGNDDDEPPITGDALAKASAAALEHTGGGQVTETEVGDEDGYYEVEVTLDDGRQVDVHLDESFKVISETADEDGANDQAGPNDD